MVPKSIRTKAKWFKSRIPYYSNSTASFNFMDIVLSGDVHPQPGPDQANPRRIPVRITIRDNKHFRCSSRRNLSNCITLLSYMPQLRHLECSNLCVCAECKMTFHYSSGLICDECNDWFHYQCAFLTYDEFIEIIFSEIAWTCLRCSTHISEEGNISDSNQCLSSGPIHCNDMNLQPGTHLVLPSGNGSTQYDSVSAINSELYPALLSNNCKTSYNHSQLDLPFENLETSYPGFFQCNKNIKGLIIGHLNIRSIKSGTKLQELQFLLQQKPCIHILTLSETWLDDSWTDDMLTINEYSLVRLDRPSGSSGGGTAIYVHNSISFIIRQELVNNVVEALCIEVTIPFIAPILILNVYRPPTANISYDSALKSCIENLSNENKEYFVLGDFNINLLCPKARSNKLIKSLKSLGLHQLVSDPTRVDNRLLNGKVSVSSTLIDHIYTSHVHNIDTVRVSDLSLSDHYPVFVVRRSNAALRTKKHAHSTIKYRSFKSFDHKKFNDDLKQAPWSAIKAFDKPSDALDTFYKMYNTIVEDHAPARVKRVRSLKLPQWLSSNIMTDIRKRNQLKKEATDAISSKEYRTFRNKVTFQIRLAKKNFYSSQIEENKNNSKMLWRVLKNASCIGTKGSIPTSIIHDEKSISDPLEIANVFNKYFSNIAKKILSDPGVYQQGMGDPLNLVNQLVGEHMPVANFSTIPPMSDKFLLQEIKNLSDHKAKGVDNINIKLLKLARQEILSSLIHIYNLSITTGIIPDQWKIGKITPIHKSGPKHEIDNYRPISVLSSLSKILERHISLNLLGHFCENKLFTDFQFGSRPSFSCETLLVKLTDEWLQTIDNGEFTGLLLIDFRKAFDLVNHDILLKKLLCYGINGNALKLFTSYLNDRKQFVSIGSSTSDTLPMSIGVPQGSCLGPLLFLVYVNDIPFANQSCSTHLYVDDTTLSCSGSSVLDLNSKLQKAADNLCQWAYLNEMVIHPKKTKSMIIGSQKKLNTNQETLCVSINGTSISQSNCEKLLGVFIDPTLSWNDHIQKTVKKFNSKLELIRRTKPYLSPKHVILLYNSIARPTLEYCCSVWGNCSADLLQQLLLSQKRAARMLLNVDFSSPSINLFKKLNFIPISETVRQRIQCLTFKCLNGSAPDCLKNLIIRPCHPYKTRAITNINLSIPKAKTNAGKRRFSFIAPTIWNSLPPEIHKISSYQSFHRKCNQLFQNKLHTAPDLIVSRLY